MPKMMVTMLPLLLLLAAFTNPLAAGPLDITITGITAPEGRIFIGLFRPVDDFPRQDRAFQGMTLPVDGPQVSAAFSDLPDGIYAVAVFHDANRNGEHDRNFFGIPREDYGFSNNAQGSFGPPAFEKAAFEHQGTSRIAITLHP